MPNRSPHIEVHRTGNLSGSLNIRDSGDGAHLWFEQRVPWRIALEILRELKAPCPAPEGDDLLRRLHSRMPASKERPAERSKERQAA
jgi:hypothetical protein